MASRCPYAHSIFPYACVAGLRALFSYYFGWGLNFFWDFFLDFVRFRDDYVFLKRFEVVWYFFENWLSLLFHFFVLNNYFFCILQWHIWRIFWSFILLMLFLREDDLFLFRWGLFWLFVLLCLGGGFFFDSLFSVYDRLLVKKSWLLLLVGRIAGVAILFEDGWALLRVDLSRNNFYSEFRSVVCMRDESRNSWFRSRLRERLFLGLVFLELREKESFGPRVGSWTSWNNLRRSYWFLNGRTRKLLVDDNWPWLQSWRFRRNE